MDGLHAHLQRAYLRHAHLQHAHLQHIRRRIHLHIYIKYRPTDHRCILHHTNRTCNIHRLRTFRHICVTHILDIDKLFFQNFFFYYIHFCIQFVLNLNFQICSSCMYTEGSFHTCKIRTVWLLMIELAISTRAIGFQC